MSPLNKAKERRKKSTAAAGKPEISYLTFHLEGASKLGAHADLRAEEEDEVDEGAEAEGYEADGGHSPGRGHVVEHEDAEMGEGCGHDE
jgi:hypothetical protein